MQIKHFLFCAACAVLAFGTGCKPDANVTPDPTFTGVCGKPKSTRTGNTTTGKYKYDSQGRLSEILSFADNGAFSALIRTERNSAGDIIKNVDSIGSFLLRSMVVQYDANHRATGGTLTEKTTFGGVSSTITKNLSYNYVNNKLMWRTEVNATNPLSRDSSAYEYNTLGKITKITRFSLNPGGYTIGETAILTYDANGKGASMQQIIGASTYTTIYNTSKNPQYPHLYNDGNSALFAIRMPLDSMFGTSEMVTYTENGVVTNYAYTYNSAGCVNTQTQTKNGVTTTYTVEY